MKSLLFTFHFLLLFNFLFSFHLGLFISLHFFISLNLCYFLSISYDFILKCLLKDLLYDFFIFHILVFFKSIDIF